MRIAKIIKLTASVIFTVEIIAAIICGFFIISKGGPLAYIGVIVLFGGPAVAFVSLLLLAGFGEIIERLCLIERNTRNGEIRSEVKLYSDVKRMGQIESLRRKDLITEEEYRQVLSKKGEPIINYLEYEDDLEYLKGQFVDGLVSENDYKIKRSIIVNKL